MQTFSRFKDSKFASYSQKNCMLAQVSGMHVICAPFIGCETDSGKKKNKLHDLTENDLTTYKLSFQDYS
jgi:hypothetical protein